MYAIRLHAEGVLPHVIQKELISKFKIKMDSKSINDTCTAKCYQSSYKAFRDSFLVKVKEVPLANKRIRLADKEIIRIKLMKHINSNTLRTKADRAEFLAFAFRLNQIGAEAREEMEKKPQLFQNVVINREDVSDENLHKRKQELLRKFRSSVGRGTSRAEPDSGGVEPKSPEEPA